MSPGLDRKDGWGNRGARSGERTHTRAAVQGVWSSGPAALRDLPVDSVAAPARIYYGSVLFIH